MNEPLRTGTMDTFDQLTTRFVGAIQKASSKELRSALPSWRNAMRRAPETKKADARKIYDLLISELSRRAD